MRLMRGIGVISCLLLAGCVGMQVRENRPGKAAVWVKRLPKSGHYQLMVERKPYFVRGVCYAPVAIGESHASNFMTDPRKPWLIDGPLMRDMGVNTIRLYHPGDDLAACRQMVDELYALYGIRTIMGHSLGFWDYPPANYTEPEFLEIVTEDVLAMVVALKDSPAVLFWNLGNENNYSFDGRINPWSDAAIDALPSFNEKRLARARIYYTFVNELARKIKAIDPDHPVSLGNGETVGLDIAGQYCPDIDILGSIVYRGGSFGNFFKEVKRKFDRPVVVTEFGCDAFNAVTQKEDQKNQAKFIRNQWVDLLRHVAGGTEDGNCLGGVIFEWNDEWWKSSECDASNWKTHDTVAGWGMGAYNFDAAAERNMNEEWFGIVALEPATAPGGLDTRLLRKAYYDLQELWQKKHLPAANRAPKK